MRTPKGHALAPGQRPDPVVWRNPAPHPVPSIGLDRTLALVFADAPDSARIRSWDHDRCDGRPAYWIACRGAVGMHADPGFGRWQHQLVVRNDGWAVVGIGRRVPDEPFRPGDLYLLDAHSPHAVARDRRSGSGRYFAAVGMAGDPMGPAEARVALERFRDRATPRR